MRGDAGDEQDGRERGQAVTVLAVCAMLCQTLVPNHLAIPEPVPESPCGVAWLADSQLLLPSVPRGRWGGAWSPARSALGKSRTLSVHVVAAL